MPASVGMWAGSFAESFLDDLYLLKMALFIVDQSPLGSAVGFGVPVPLDRKLTARLLGFAKVQKNSLYCQNSRGKVELAIIAVLTQILLTLNKFASDVLFFTSSELNYFKVDSTLCTGSSIMPQKNNVDIAELIKSKAHLIIGNLTAVASLSTNLISGYNRDLQDSKKLIVESLEFTGSTISVSKKLIEGLLPNNEALYKAMTPELFATHKVYELVAEGTPFRHAYQTIGKDIKSIQKLSQDEIEQLLKSTSHVGSTGNLGLKKLTKHVQKMKMEIDKKKKAFSEALQKLVETHE